MTSGVVVIDKPPGMTSHDVVDRVRKVFSTKRVGHAGTLDPDATGVLVVGVGPSTRLLDYLKDAPKRYLARGRLGVSTTTQDASGEVVAQRSVTVTRSDVEDALARFRGDIEQVPPMVSAVKVGGERLYRKALRGEEVERPARRVTIHELTLTDAELPDLGLDVTCSAGTYIRTLVHDLGEALGCGAHMTALRRVAAAGFEITDAVALDDLQPGHLLSPREAMRILPTIEVAGDEQRAVGNGRPIPNVAGAEGLVALVGDDELLAVYRGSGRELVPDRVLAR